MLLGSGRLRQEPAGVANKSCGSDIACVSSFHLHCGAPSIHITQKAYPDLPGRNNGHGRASKAIPEVKRREQTDLRTSLSRRMFMADQKAPQMEATLGLTGLTSNAMALIAPGAFLWLTFFIQATTGVAGQPSTAPAMWAGIFAALLLCLATAVAYAEISKLYPGTGSSYYYADQAMLSKYASFKHPPTPN